MLKKAINLHKNGQIIEAKDAYQLHLKKHKNDLIALKNLAIIEKQLGNYLIAQELTNRALILAPNDPILRSNYGNQLRANGENLAAIEQYKIALKLLPNFEEAKLNLAKCYAEEKKYEEALNTLALIEKKSNLELDTLMLNGQILIAIGQKHEAIKIFDKVLESNPNNTNALNIRGALLISLKEYSQALNDFQASLKINPNDEEALFAVSAISSSGQAIKTAPLNYVKNLFNNYSGHFEEHLIKKLEYKTPQLLFDQFIEHYKLKNKINILDLGCGTGLSGEAFNAIKLRLDGVDLSNGMIEQCAKKKIYDALYCDDIVEFMINSEMKYELVVCADVLVYLGDLTKFFESLRNVVSKNGWVSFSVESTNSETYELKPTRRFGHSYHYINQLALTNNFKVINIEKKFIRKEAGEPIEGLVVLLQYY